MIANNIKITVFVKEEEDKEKIKQTLLSLFPFDLEENKIMIKQSNTQGFNEKTIQILEIMLEKERHIKQFLEHLLSKLSQEAKELILRQAESRIDEDCNFYLRFSKDKLVNEKELWITDQGNCFHIKINLACFPKNKEKAIEIINKLFKF